MSTEDALRDALDQAQQVEKLMEAMRSCPDKSQVSRGPGLGWPGGEPRGARCPREAWPCPGNPGLDGEVQPRPLGVPAQGGTWLDPEELRFSWGCSLALRALVPWGPGTPILKSL